MIVDMQLKPKHVRIFRYSTVKFIIGDNHSEIDTGIYQTRFFYLELSGKHTYIESGRLKQGDAFSHTFDEVGKFNIQC